MKASKFLWALFTLMVIVQLWVPANMIRTSETAIANGQIFRFKTIPVDPNDPFRGKYIRLRYEVEQQRYPKAQLDNLEYNETAYATIYESYGYANIEEISSQKPTDWRPFVKVKVVSQTKDSVYARLPFDKFFMEESLAQPAEDAVRSLQSDSTSVVYAEVSVLNGNAVLQEVYINDEPIADYVRARR